MPRLSAPISSPTVHPDTEHHLLASVDRSVRMAAECQRERENRNLGDEHWKSKAIFVCWGHWCTRRAKIIRADERRQLRLEFETCLLTQPPTAQHDTADDIAHARKLRARERAIRAAGDTLHARLTLCGSADAPALWGAEDSAGPQEEDALWGAHLQQHAGEDLPAMEWGAAEWGAEDSAGSPTVEREVSGPGTERGTEFSWRLSTRGAGYTEEDDDPSPPLYSKPLPHE
ncbi:hypothetical protein GGX14DRAFT_571424 [Mycena pura]|uniref:Uncharacterized protein n=1 Tax=Mycena pura TaxID=153505 RepID=A0AAD6Y7V9_9AGAR|nr:hypothetical protein GGX14DRAFT_571424 [Mycena pura]